MFGCFSYKERPSKSQILIRPNKNLYFTLLTILDKILQKMKKVKKKHHNIILKAALTYIQRKVPRFYGNVVLDSLKKWIQGLHRQLRPNI